MVNLPTAATLPVSIQRFSTAAYTPRERVSVWRELYGRTIARLDFDPLDDNELMAEASLRSLPGLGLVSMASTALRFYKPKSLINNDDVILMIVDTGHWTGTQLGREVRLQAGDAVLCTNAEVASGTSFGRRVMFRVPVKSLAPVLPDIGNMLSRRIPRETEGLQLLRQYLRTMQDSEALAKPELQRLTVAHVHDLLAVTLGATRDAAEVTRDRGVRAARLHGIKEDIALNLEHGDISIAAIATRHRVTPRTVQKLFEHDGTTFTDHVLGERLAFARRLLSDPKRATEKIATIAFMAGFGDVSYFYRVFRRRYDVLPTDVRAQARPLN